VYRSGAKSADLRDKTPADIAFAAGLPEVQDPNVLTEFADNRTGAQDNAFVEVATRSSLGLKSD